MGAWLRSTEIPPDRGGYGAGVIVSDRTDERVAQIIQEAAKSGAGPDSIARKIADYHASYMDEAGIEAKPIVGGAPLPMWKLIAAPASLAIDHIGAKNSSSRSG